MKVNTPVSIGELLDKITILEIKRNKITDTSKLKHVEHELALLLSIWQQQDQDNTDVKPLINELRNINLQLWDIEDKIRLKEAVKQFDDDFIQLARSVYITNDKRAQTKRHLNELLGSELFEEKSYADY